MFWLKYPRNEPTLDGLLDAHSGGVRAWARAAAEWSGEVGVTCLTPAAFAAVAPGNAPGLCCVGWELSKRAPSMSALRSLFCRAGEVALREFPTEHCTAGWSPELAEIWQAVCHTCLFASPSANELAPFRLWDELVASASFGVVFHHAGIEHAKLRRFSTPRGGGGESMYRQARLLKREVRLASALDEARPGAPAPLTSNKPQYAAPTLERMCHAADPDVQAWTVAAIDWARTVTPGLVGVAAFGATACRHSAVGYEVMKTMWLEGRLARPRVDAIEAAARERAAAERQSSEEPCDGCVASEALVTGWQAVRARRASAASDGRSLSDEAEFWSAMLSAPDSPLVRILLAGGIGDGAVRDVMRERQEAIESFERLLMRLSGF